MGAGMIALAQAGHSAGMDGTAPQASSSTMTAPPAPAAVPAAVVAPAASASGVSVEKIAAGTGVENHEIVGEASEFPAGTDKVYCLSRVVAANAPATVKHVWYKDGTKLSEVPLNIKFSPFTTYSYHFMEPGHWKVEVQDDSGAAVSSVEFTVK
jgi:hypothetical protein